MRDLWSIGIIRPGLSPSIEHGSNVYEEGGIPEGGGEGGEERIPI